MLTRPGPAFKGRARYLRRKKKWKRENNMETEDCWRKEKNMESEENNTEMQNKPDKGTRVNYSGRKLRKEIALKRKLIQLDITQKKKDAQCKKLEIQKLKKKQVNGILLPKPKTSHPSRLQVIDENPLHGWGRDVAACTLHGGAPGGFGQNGSDDEVTGSKHQNDQSEPSAVSINIQEDQRNAFQTQNNDFRDEVMANETVFSANATNKTRVGTISSGDEKSDQNSCHEIIEEQMDMLHVSQSETNITHNVQSGYHFSSQQNAGPQVTEDYLKVQHVSNPLKRESNENPSDVPPTKTNLSHTQPDSILKCSILGCEFTTQENAGPLAAQEIMRTHHMYHSQTQLMRPPHQVTENQMEIHEMYQPQNPLMGPPPRHIQPDSILRCSSPGCQFAAQQNAGPQEAQEQMRSHQNWHAQNTPQGYPPLMPTGIPFSAPGFNLPSQQSNMSPIQPAFVQQPGKPIFIAPSPSPVQRTENSTINNTEKITNQTNYFYNVPMNATDPDDAQIQSQVDSMTGDVEANRGQRVFFEFEQYLLNQLRKNSNKPEMSSKFKSTFHDLDMYFPSKLSVQQLMANCPSNTIEAADIPFKLLDCLVKTDLQARNIKVSKKEIRVKSASRKDRLLNKKSENTNECVLNLNPQDVFLLSYLSCNLPLKQLVLEKMFLSKLAIPWLLPSPKSGVELLMTKWALESIQLNWSGSDEEACSANALHHKNRIISFVRVGNPNMSKSILMNELINKYKHDTFFHKDCPEGENQRLIGNGVVEVAWYLPGGNDKHNISEPLTLLNLRGDALDYQNQIEILTKISQSLVIIAEPEKMNTDSDVMSLLRNCKSRVIRIWVQNKGKEEEDVDTQFQTFNHPNEVPGEDMFEFDHNRNGLLETLFEYIEKITRTERCPQQFSFNEIAIMNHDKTEEEFSSGYKDAKKQSHEIEVYIHNVLKSNKNQYFDLKTCLFPLQADHLWKKWGQNEKQDKREKKFTNDKSKNRIEMEKIEKEQQWKGMSKFMNIFIESLNALIDDEIGSLIFLQNIQKMFSKMYEQNISPYRKKRIGVRDNLRSAKEKKIDTGQLQSQINALDEKINTAISIESIFREMGQIFQTRKKEDEDEINLPIMIAKLVLWGMPVEILDGDAKSMPRKWLKHVFTAIGSLLGKKKILSISVIGIQSSGKSTFLNALYGANFSVNVGRCTSGVSMKLIPVNQSENKRSYNYLAILDTEGLRSNELIDDPQRDNELALLSVGSANLSLVNIKGESVAEIKDILQIVVHASLRMKLANRTKTKCFFISQNVSAHNAKENMKEGLQRTVDELDMMTEEAADMEKIGNITAFNQVLDFDMKSNVFYIPDFWIGKPPMAFVSQEYTYEINNVSNFIYREMNNIEQRNFISIEQMFEKIGDLWDAILSENFVFRFKNSLEVRSYDDLEIKVSEVMTEFERTLNSIRCDLEITMDKLATNDLDSELQTLIQNLKSTTIKEEDVLLNDLQSFFENHPNKAILEEYRVTQLQIVKKKIEKVTEDQISILKEYKKNKDIVSDSARFLAEFSSEITKQSKLAAKEYEGLNCSVAQVKGRFESLWKEKLARLNLDTHAQSNEYRTSMAIDFLTDYFRDIHSKILMIHKSSMIDRLANFEDLKYLYKPDRILYQSHFNVNKKFWTNLKFWKDWETKSQKEIYNTILMCFDKIDDYFKKYKSKSGAFKPESFDTQKLRELADYSDKLLTIENEEILIMPALKIEVTVDIFRYALYRFDIMHRKYEAEHNLKNKIEADKEKHWHTFLDEVRNIEHDISLAHTFTSIIKDKIIEKTEKMLTDDIEYDTKKEFSRKLELLIKLQRDLLDKDFDDMHFYVNFPKKYAYKYIKENVECVYFTASEKKYINKAKNLVCNFIENLRKTVENTEQMFEESTVESKLKKWIFDFRQQTNDIGFPEEIFQILYFREDIEKFEVFQEQVVEDFGKLKEELLSDFANKTKETANFHGADPYQTALDQIWGCEETCWFCGEVCRHDEHDPATKAHECVQHRPAGLTGWHKVKTNIMVVSNCTYNVSSPSETFLCYAIKKKNSKRCSQCTCSYDNSERHYYKEFKNYVDDWEIIPENVFESSQYWIYILCNYEKELCEFYNIDPSDKIPASWREITKDDAYSNLTSGLIQRS